MFLIWQLRLNIVQGQERKLHTKDVKKEHNSIHPLADRSMGMDHAGL